jgi:GT2 family glycosyltransferase
MQPRVTAILVARNGAKHLDRTLEALRNQTRQPDTVITVDCGSTDATGELLAAYGPTHLLSADSDLSFGQAIAAALRVTAPPSSEKEMLWLLAQDSAPEPGALAALLGQLEISPSVAVAGPKVMEWDAAEYINNFGQSMTPFGTTVTLVEAELDQGQNDGLSDVLAVSAAGMLVRHTVWDELKGFDPALPVVDDSLDFCVRVRLAGYRVSVVPAARVVSAQDGVAGPNGSSRGRARRKRLRAGRAAQLHRRLVYAPGWAVPLHWLSLVPLAFFRSIVQLLRKEPGAIVGEFSAAFATAFDARGVGAARKQFAATKKLGWASIASLRVPAAEVRRRLALKREASLTGVQGARPDIRFFAGGGAWTMLAAAVAGVALLAPLLGARTLTGGGLLPLDGSPAELWQSVAYGWRDIGLGFVGAADPFAAVVAVLGSLTFWQPSFVLVLLYFLALPLAAVGAWTAATRLTERGWLRATAAALWVLAPTFLSALATGRPSAILVHLLLPWLFFAGYAAARSWSASASAALLFAAVVACAPSLTPALLAGWLICVIMSGRSVMRFIGIPIPALALAAPLIWDQGIRGTWLSLLADPGAPVPGSAVSAWQLAFGFPSGAFGGWTALLQSLGIATDSVEIIVPIFLAPLALLAVLGLFLPGSRSSAFALVAALLGFATAVAATHLVLTHVGATPVSVWPGAGLSLYWLGIVGAVVIALRNISSFAVAPAVATALALALVAAPLAAAVPLGTSVVAEGTDRTLPAFVTAEAQTDPRVGTLQIVPQRDGGLRATVVRGSDITLNDQSTLYNTDTALTAAEEELAVLAGNLASRSGMDASSVLDEFGISFVLLSPPTATPTVPGGGVPATLAEAETTARTTTALDGNAALAPVGDTTFGRLWRHDPGAEVSPYSAIPPNAGGPLGLVFLVVAAIIIGATVLLSIPTGAGREALRQANRDTIKRLAKANAKAAAQATAAAKADAKTRARDAGKKQRKRQTRAAAAVPPTDPSPAGASPTDAPSADAPSADAPSADAPSADAPANAIETPRLKENEDAN